MSHVIAVSDLAEIDRYAATAALALLGIYALRAVTGLLIAGLLTLLALTGRSHRQTQQLLGRLALRVSPVFLRGTIVAITAASVSITAGASAHASSTLPDARADRPTLSERRAPAAGPISRPIVAIPERDGTQPQLPQQVTASPRTHVVSKGESLWTIAADALGRRAAHADVARAWPELYRANRDAIGADPNLVDVGLPLELPDSLAAGQNSSAAATTASTATTTTTTQGCVAK